MADEALGKRFRVLARDTQKQQHFQKFVIRKGFGTVGFHAGSHPGAMPLRPSTACQVNPGR
ncbi:hypothetical protein [Gluconobacter japonicus]|uniref:hypothetical protein n=1 Tax=Gluconobacter japonicus TaxID=376620 RepID=UPI0020A41ECD|nr:hypothetical protein [Gluconobacter japonicus]